MNFNASRNGKLKYCLLYTFIYISYLYVILDHILIVNQSGGIRKAKRVSDVAAMGAPSPTPAFSPAPAAAYNPQAFNQGPPPPYQEGIQVDNNPTTNMNQQPSK